MNILVVGGGGREHAILWKLAQSPKVDTMYCIPGNAGISKLAQCIDLSVDNIEGVARFADEKKIDLTVVGPEAPLVSGIVDVFKAKGLRIFGPTKMAAQIEGSKVFAKNLMEKYGIPTASHRVFDDPVKAVKYITEVGPPLVVKADGLAAGKGVIIAKDEQTALMAVKSIMREKVFGKAGDRIIIEEYLEGPEVTVLSFCDGEKAVPMVSSRDHKRIYDNDCGPNTGGMGAISPAPAYSPEIAQLVEKGIIQKTVDAMAKEGRPFIGVLYTGLILTEKGPKVLEYNCRFGDPETQVVLPRLKTDLIDVMEDAIDCKLDSRKIEWSDEKAVCIILASKGYPGAYEKGIQITDLQSVEGEKTIVFHSGTNEKGGKFYTAGGRVLGVTSLGNTTKEARQKAYTAVNKIHFDGMQYRKDIGN
jgi:phosphoribosylamine--glycine ligase